MFKLSIVWRYLASGRRIFNLSTWLCILGMSIGVASLVVALAVVSGFQSTLKKSVIDVVGHLLVIRRGHGIENQQKVMDEIKTVVPDVQSFSPFVYLEGVLAHNKKVSGIMIEGLETETLANVINLQRRVVEGEFNLETQDGVAGAVIGKGVAQKFDLKVGDVFRVVIPSVLAYRTDSFRSKAYKVRVAGIINFGRFDYDSRYVMTQLAETQKWADIGSRVTGFRLKIKDPEKAAMASYRIDSELGYPYWSRDWRDVNRNLFEAAELEKVVIFFVLSIMLVAASFNVSSFLFFSVLKKYGDISILKTMGADNKFIRQLFTLQGLLVGAVGSFLGIVLGAALAYGFSYALTQWALLPGEVYKLDHIEVELRFLDIAATFAVAMLICFLSTLAPAIRGSKMTAVEGLKYE